MLSISLVLGVAAFLWFVFVGGYLSEFLVLLHIQGLFEIALVSYLSVLGALLAISAHLGARPLWLPEKPRPPSRPEAPAKSGARGGGEAAARSEGRGPTS